MYHAKKMWKLFLGLAIIAGLLPLQPTGKAFASAGAFVSQVSARRTHSLGMKSDGTVSAWGLNQHGQIHPFTAILSRMVTSKLSYEIGKEG